MILRRSLCVAVLAAAVCVSARVTANVIYKCDERGVITYTDRPCSPQAQRAELPALIVAQPPPRALLERAAAYDARQARDLAERERRDAEWLKAHGQKRQREDLVREAKVRGKVVKGMTPDEVRQALGEPDGIDSGDSFGTEKQTWTYMDGKAKRTVSFKDGAVTTTARKDAPRKK
ncbi:MAG TPA: DUF4124 domain-containing protein [Verrucomicrobiae bacterium]|nr:DUF4124 domain-containing protein [Verrucomicrobiae bacterium]